MGLDQIIKIRKTRTEQEFRDVVKHHFGNNVRQASPSQIEKQYKKVNTEEAKFFYTSDQGGLFLKGDFEQLRFLYTSVSSYRKFYALQNYFEKKTDIDNLEEKIMTPELIDELEAIVESVLKYNEEHNEKESGIYADKLFPTDVRWGENEPVYDEYYYNALTRLLDDISVIKNTLLDEDEDFIYSCWY